MALSTLTLIAVSQTPKSASLRGTVRDQQAAPLHDVTVVLQSTGSVPTITVHTDAQGRYRFSAAAGVYALRAEMVGYVTATISSLFLSANEEKSVDLTLTPAHSGSPDSPPVPQFSDSPQFTVSGVTDTTSLGGHGSDTVVRTRDSLAKETASLGKADARSSPASGASLREEAEHERERLQVLLLQHPDDVTLHHEVADLDEKLADPLAAVREYQRAAELDPSEGNLFDWGAELLLHHAPEPAGDVFAKGNGLFPNSARMLLGLGAAWFARGDLDQAVGRICQASELNPNDSLPYLFLGKIERAETLLPAQVIEALRRFVTLQPANAAANYYYAIGLWKLRKSAQDATQVEALLNKAVELDPQFAAAYLQLGILHAERGEDSKAIFDYQRALAIATERSDADSETVASVVGDAHYRLAQAYRRMGDAVKAKSELQLYETMVRESGEKLDRERHEIRQFVYTLRDRPPAEIR